MPSPPSRPRGNSRRPAFTGRAAVLALVLCTLAVMLADPVRSLLEQRSQIAKVRESNAALKQQVASLTDENARWNDPDYIRQQARDRLFYVMPGDTAYVVVGGDSSAAHRAAASTSQATASGSDSAWFTQLWASVRRVGEPPHSTAAGKHAASQHPPPIAPATPTRTARP